ncbi:putative cell division protein ftsY [Mycobacterium intracellulare 1956]|uniref:Putative cell division protein ftsY n=1 Tax=Mycobacterium intracellulare 1956 TaxID=1299331 RepID=X8CK98_MYCIT|nr:putative cell division protein ftsY [Mycobacterium intracellulare 1956]
MSQGLWIALAVLIALVVLVALVLGLLRYRRRRISFSTRAEPGAIDRSGGYTASSGITFSQTPTVAPPERLDTTGLPGVGDDATIPRDAPRRTISDVDLPEPETVAPPPIPPRHPNPKPRRPRPRRPKRRPPPRSRRSRRPRAAWNGCAAGWPVRKARSAAACWA